MQRARQAIMIAACGWAGCLGGPDEVSVGSLEAGQVASEVRPLYSVALRLEPAGSLSLPVRMGRVAKIQQRVIDAFAPGELEVVRRFKLVPGFAVRVGSLDVIDILGRHPDVLAVGLDVGGEATLDLSRIFVGAATLQANGQSGQGRTVAVIDTGVDTDHPDLAADLLDGACFCLAGINCCGTGNTGLGLASAEDDAGHGTHVTGIITSAGTVAPLGIAPDAQVVVVKVMNNQRLAATSDIVRALEWIRINHPNVDAVNLSLGSRTRYPANCDVPGPGYSPPAFMISYKLAFDLVREVGILPVVSAGNDADHNRSGAPGCLSNVFTVGSTANNSDTISGFSNSTAALDLWAPGDQIMSTYLVGAAAGLSGTSMSAPHVTAAAAIVRQANAFHPVQTLHQCLQASRFSVRDPINNITRPRLDLPTAFAACGDFANGAACTVGPECASGFCTDGVCCNTSCGGPGVDCMACAQAVGAAVDGQCTIAQAGTACRPSSGTCDLAEICDGVGASCPADQLRGAGVSCRVSQGDCDLSEVCSGTQPQCPPDAKFGGICRAPVGPCDRAESCDGVRDTCPPDLLSGPAITCRAPAGACDVAERCSGGDVGCPPDVLVAGGTCRAAVGPCDVAEQCTGVAGQCPQDAFVGAGASCREPAGPCDAQDFCDGTGALCPEDAKRTSACRASSGACDIEEFCDGVADTCPQDVLRDLGFACRGSAGVCDREEFCDGQVGICPPDQTLSSTVSCRPSQGVCDIEEFCDGQGGACPQDEDAVDGLACGDDLECNGVEACRNGTCVAGPTPDCDDQNPCTVGQCVEPEGCVQTQVAGCCISNEGCDDGNLCTDDLCAGSACSHTPIGDCCIEDEQCGTGRVCNDNRCVAFMAPVVPGTSAPSGGCRCVESPGPTHWMGLMFAVLGWLYRRRPGVRR